MYNLKKVAGTCVRVRLEREGERKRWSYFIGRYVAFPPLHAILDQKLSH